MKKDLDEVLTELGDEFLKKAQESQTKSGLLVRAGEVVLSLQQERVTDAYLDSYNLTFKKLAAVKNV